MTFRQVDWTTVGTYAGCVAFTVLAWLGLVMGLWALTS